MSRKPASIAPEAIATIDRAIVTLNALKSQLRAKKLRGTALRNLLQVAQEELRVLDGPFDNLYYAEIDELVSSTRHLLDKEP